MNSLISNKTNETILRIPFLNDIDNMTRGIMLTVHVIYFVAVSIFKDFQSIAYFNINHINLIGLLTGIHYCIWINSTIFYNQIISYSFCSISEATWAILKFARTYSILTLAIYRYLAVFKEFKFYKFISSFKYTLLSGLLVWFWQSLFF